MKAVQVKRRVYSSVMALLNDSFLVAPAWSNGRFSKSALRNPLRPVQQFLLDAGCEKNQSGDLGNPRSAESHQPSDLSVVLHFPAPDHPLPLVGQRQQPEVAAS